MTPEEARAALIAGRARTPGRQTEYEARLRAKIASRAQGQALRALTRLHPEEYRELYQTAKADLLAEEGLT